MTGSDALASVLDDVSRETTEKLRRYAQRLTEWNRKINLVSPSDLVILWHRHIVDCAQLITMAPRGSVWLDIGSGAGLPGMVVALLLPQYGGGHVHLVESNRKKAAFLISVASELQAPVTVHPRRIESLHGQLRDVDVVTARAVAALPQLFRLAEPWLATAAIGLLQKGRDYAAELEQCRDEWMFTLIEHPSTTDSNAVILEVSGLESRSGSGLVER